MAKLKLTAEEAKVVSAEMKKAVQMSGSDREQFIAMTIGEVYDEEIGVAPMIEALAEFVVAGNRPEDNHVYYKTPDSINKKVFVLDGNCNVTQVQVTPNSRAELALQPIVSQDYWICLQDFLKGDHDALAFAAEAIGEAMDRIEIKKVLEALDAGAVAEGNVFAPESGDTKLDFPKVVEMYESLAKYGTKFVFVTGSNVTNDVTLMDYVADTNRPYTLQNLNITHVPVLDYTVDVDGSGQEELIDPDVAYLVAVSDAKGRKPILVARRSMAIVGGAADTTVVEKQRIVIDTGNIKNVGSTVKFAKGKAGYEEFGMVLMNSKVVAKFSK